MDEPARRSRNGTDWTPIRMDGRYIVARSPTGRVRRFTPAAWERMSMHVPRAEVRTVTCWQCAADAPTVWGNVRDPDEPDNHTAPCGRPCLAGGVPIEYRGPIHDGECSACTVQ